MSLPFALLGLLNYAPMTGYDLKKIFDESINFFWAAQTSQIYRELKALEKKGFIVSTVHPGEKGPDKRVYSISELGKSSLKDWLVDMPHDIDENIRNTFLIRVFFSSQIGVDELYFQIQKRLKEYKKELQMLKIVENNMPEYGRIFGVEGEVPYWKIVLNRGFHDVESNIRWAEETLDYLGKLRGEKMNGGCKL